MAVVAATAGAAADFGVADLASAGLAVSPAAFVSVAGLLSAATGDAGFASDAEDVTAFTAA